MRSADSSSSTGAPLVSERGGGVARKQGFGLRAWLLVDGHGGTQVVEAGKHAIMKRTALPARDLRILDPLLSYPSTILGRESAIVINLEHVKAIITSQEVLLLNSTDPAVAPFVTNLQRRLHNAYSPFLHQVNGSGEGAHSDSDMEYASKEVFTDEAVKLRYSKEEEDHYIKGSLHGPSFMDESMDLSSQATGSRPQSSNLSKRLGPSAFPFEFLALEACLEAACSSLDAKTEALEREAYPALDELTVKISTLNLERVRQLKSRLVAISARVRDELEQLLDDDGDMNEMYLTDKLTRKQLEGLGSPAHSNCMHEAYSVSVDKVNSDNGGSIVPHSKESHANISNLESKVSRCSSATTNTSNGRYQDVEELEMLLEAYFVQIDGILNKLSALREYVDDTEDYINIMLDDKQNHLLQMGVMMTTGTLVMSIFVVVTAIFGMNIEISLFDNGGLPQFLWVIGGSASGAMFIYILVITWCKHKRLLE
ncbi:magnesium transporter MRS2-3 isoform X2 [Cryptomeria japonica]|uniref:magnesium transporter MRS2-3 isoform X2 n=1 Tax=Cryptomeria japonica TaxID=3369 RepID=UPI0027D9DD17|nr:magnesium transporter MRS2-3 isoform X2 [Cryptomeria japonica]